MNLLSSTSPPFSHTSQNEIFFFCILAIVAGMITLTLFFGFQLGQSFAHPAFYLPISLLGRCFLLLETYYYFVLLSAMLYFLPEGHVGEREAMILQVRLFFHDDGSYLWVWV
jgi:hypothetical protein